MLGFATPAALLALGFLAVPIALHLWSRRTGRPQRIGSIAFFAAAPPPATRHPRLDDLWLLVLRCAVIAVLVAALAGPSWRADGRARGATWALVDSASAAEPSNDQLLDSLRATGAEVRVLGAGHIWSQLREADFQAPPGTRLTVVAPNRGAEGSRPTLRAEVEWLVPPLPKGEGVGGEDARRTATVGSMGTVRTVLIYSDAGRRDDARYVSAALRAAGEVTGQPAVITQRDVTAMLSDADWIVWLAAQSVPSALIERTRRGGVLLTDALAAEPQDEAGRVRLAAASDPDAPPPLMRRRAAPEPARAYAPLWTDDAGHPVLTVQREGAGLWLRFHARFHPSWGDLVLHPAFPEAIAGLWASDRVRAPGAGAAERPVAVSQLLPARDASARGQPAPARTDLYHMFWLAGLVLFLLERLLARRARAESV